MVTFARVPGEFNEGEQRLVPDDMAQDLLREKKITAMDDWPAQEQAADAEPGRRETKPVLADRIVNHGNRKADRFAPRRAR